jgi:uncharacterized protein YbbK (DUF523 family)
VPPARYGTTKRIGLDGKPCAKLREVARVSAAAAIQRKVMPVCPEVMWGVDSRIAA